MEAREGTPGVLPAPRPGSRRGFIGMLVAGFGVVGATAVNLIRRRGVDEGGYRRVVTWKIPDGEGLFIAVAPNLGAGELRALGERLRSEFRGRRDMVVMVFDDSEAARQVRRGSRYVGEDRFRAALAHQRAMYLKDAARSEHSFTILGDPPEVIRF